MDSGTSSSSLDSGLYDPYFFCLLLVYFTPICLRLSLKHCKTSVPDALEKSFLPLKTLSVFNKGVPSHSRDNSVSVATRYGLEGPGIESQWRARFFRTCLDRPWDPPSLLYSRYRVFPGVKGPGRGVDHPPTSSAEVKGRVELYLCPLSGPPWPVLG